LPIPEYIQTVRNKIGHDYLFLPGVVVVVFDDAGRVLLNQRSDSGQWALISGIPEPGEQPADVAVRECFEETGVKIVVRGLVDAYTSSVFTHANGDVAQYLTVVYRAHKISGEPVVCDAESLAVRFFALDELPPIRSDLMRVLQAAVVENNAKTR